MGKILTNFSPSKLICKNYMAHLDPKQTVNFIKDIPFFSEVHEASLLNLCKGLETNVFRKNQVIINKGE